MALRQSQSTGPGAPCHSPAHPQMTSGRSPTKRDSSLLCHMGSPLGPLPTHSLPSSQRVRPLSRPGLSVSPQGCVARPYPHAPTTVHLPHSERPLLCSTNVSRLPTCPADLWAVHSAWLAPTRLLSCASFRPQFRCCPSPGLRSFSLFLYHVHYFVPRCRLGDIWLVSFFPHQTCSLLRAGTGTVHSPSCFSTGRPELSEKCLGVKI